MTGFDVNSMSFIIKQGKMLARFALMPFDACYFRALASLA